MPVKTTRRRDRAARAAAFLIAASALALGPVTAAQATTGSVPAVVAGYAADPKGLLARLDDLFGEAGGKGIDLAGATVGELDRAFTWRDDFAAGESTDTAVTLSNEWTATISVDDKPVGVATIFINPDDDAPDLADFTIGSAVGTAFAALAADATLVHDVRNAAWFTLSGTELTVVVPGTSGVAKSTTLKDYQQLLVKQNAVTPAQGGPGLGTINSIAVIVLGVFAVTAIVVFMGRRRDDRPDAAPVAVPQGALVVPPPVAPVATQPAMAAPAPEVIPAPEAAVPVPTTSRFAPPEPPPALKAPEPVEPPAKPSRATGAAARGGTPRAAPKTAAKPAAAKPAGAAAKKPVTAKPTTARPTTARPATAKPATAKPATTKPAAAKPTAAKPTAAKPTTAKPAAKPAARAVNRRASDSTPPADGPAAR